MRTTIYIFALIIAGAINISYLQSYPYEIIGILFFTALLDIQYFFKCCN